MIQGRAWLTLLTVALVTGTAISFSHPIPQPPPVRRTQPTPTPSPMPIELQKAMDVDPNKEAYDREAERQFRLRKDDIRANKPGEKGEKEIAKLEKGSQLPQPQVLFGPVVTGKIGHLKTNIILNGVERRSRRIDRYKYKRKDIDTWLVHVVEKRSVVYENGSINQKKTGKWTVEAHLLLNGRPPYKVVGTAPYKTKDGTITQAYLLEHLEFKKSEPGSGGEKWPSKT